MRRPKARKLYHRISELSVPESISEFRGNGNHTYRVNHQLVPVAVHVSWPSGKPCLAVNMYLLDKCWVYTGDSVVTVAAKLSELIRYCANGRPDQNPCNFAELNDNDIARLIGKLCTDMYIDEPNERLRNNNSVRSIMHSVFEFLVWHQDHLIGNGRRIIGTRSEGAAIIVKRKQNLHNQRYYFDHRYLPPSESTDPKLPIDFSMIESIEAVIEQLEYAENHPEAALRRFGHDAEYLENYLSYLTSRRTFMIFIMRTTGLRPEEMIRMSVSANDKSIRADYPMLILPTMKRRRLDPPLRKFPVTTKQAMRVRLYLRSRAKWATYSQARNVRAIDSDAMFLNVTHANLGEPISKSALHKDFEQICNRAGFRNQQSCFSMFRHRFITDLVHMHLLAFDDQKGQLNKQDYRTMLEKVRERTGHKSVNSLWHYIDLVRNMDGVWNPVEKAISRAQAAEQLNYELRQLRKDMREGTLDMSASEVIDHVAARLDQMINAANRE